MRFSSTRVQGVLDFVSGVVLALSPWLFGFSHYVYLPHLVLGLFEIGAALMTHTHPVHEITAVPVNQG